MTSSDASNITSSPDSQTTALTSTIIVYVITLTSMATVGVVVPQMEHLSRELGASMAELGFAIGLYSLPAALFSIPLGAVIDRLGSKKALVLAALFALAADLMILRSGTLLSLQMGLLVAGIANAIIITAAPALLMTTLSGHQQVRAMSLWSTYGPAGYALGLLIGAPFSGEADWRMAVLCLAGLMAAATLASLLVLPDPGRAPPGLGRPAIGELFSFFSDGIVLRIAVGYGAVAGLSYGSSLAAPGYLANAYGVSISASATLIATAKIVAMLLGGVGMGWVLGAGRDGRAMLIGICAFGLMAQFALYFPGSGLALATSAMIAWLFAYGAISAMSFVALAQANKDPAKAGVTSGIIGQISSLGCALASSIYFSVQEWTSFVTIAALCLVLAFLLFPNRQRKNAA